MNHLNPPNKRIIMELENLIVYIMEEDAGFLFMSSPPRYYAINTKYNLEVGPHSSIESALYQYCSVYKEYKSKLIKKEQIDSHIDKMAGNVTPMSPRVIHLDFRSKKRL